MSREDNRPVSYDDTFFTSFIIQQITPPHMETYYTSLASVIMNNDDTRSRGGPADAGSKA